MLLCDHGGYLGGALVRGLPGALENVVPELLPSALVLLPPAGHGRHIVARGGADTHVGIAVTVAKLGLGRGGGHALDTEAHDAELVENAGNTRGDHAEVLTAHEHAGRVEERRQLHHCLVRPVLVLLAPEEGFVHGAELVLGVAMKLVKGRGLPHLDAGVELGPGLVVVAEEDHVVDERVHPLEDLLGLLVADGRALFGDNVADGDLAPEPRLEAVRVAAPRVEPLVRDDLPVVAKQPLHQVPLHIGLAKAVNVVDALPVKLLLRDRQAGGELSEQAPGGRRRHLPDTEEAKDVVNAVGVEILGHGPEARAPPAEAVLAHLTPVVCRKAPILAVLRVVVGGRARLLVHVEEVGLEPGVDAVVVDPDWEVALEHHPLALTVLRRLLELQVKPVLDHPVEGDALVQVRIGGGKLLELLHRDLACAQGAPILVIGRAKEVPQPAEDPVGPDPALVALEEGLELLALEHLGADGLVDLPQEAPLGIDHLRVVHGAVKFRLEILVPLNIRVVLGVVEALNFLLRLRFEVGGDALDRLHAEVEGVQGKDGDGGVGVRIPLVPVRRRVCDGKKLQDLHLGPGAPVGHGLEVKKLPHAHAVLAPQAKDGERDARAAPLGLVERPLAEVHVVVLHDAAEGPLVGGGAGDGGGFPLLLVALVPLRGVDGLRPLGKVQPPTVLALFHSLHLLVLVDDDVPVKERKLRLGHHDVHLPLGVVVATHNRHLSVLPLAQGV
mmetsp:Transcript_6306/g.16140  ORF Transcript_6306/g.16140 Transcript_6306/m.16140 type:complete len:726 (-) Transcript_6306:375-2552(-)